jgi:predicted metal-binding membrane protein
MILLFVSGIMNILWIAVISLFVLFEKVVPAKVFSSIAGIVLIAYGVVILLR